MAEANPGQSPSSLAQATSTRDPPSRDRLALVVVIGSFLTIFGFVFALLVLAGQNSNGASAVAEKTFNTTLPVLAAWVGSVLAFYFSARSNERTSDSLNQVIAQTGGLSTPSVTVSEKMIPFGSIREPINLRARSPETIQLSELQEKFKTSDGGAPITRLVFHDDGVFRYVLHESTLNAFLEKNRAATATVTPPPPLPTFAGLLADPESLRQISKLVVFVSASATLKDAKAALDAVPGAQDIIVTGTGNASGPMLGWLTNVDLIKVLTFS
jgi:hypothetical protein